MKKLAFLLTGLAMAANSLLAGNLPRGSLLELHSCELYAGGCTVSSQATLEGRYMLRAWNFAEGSQSGQNLAGLSLAILQTSSHNLAAQDAAAEQAVVYLPQSATPAQREALLAWAKTTLTDLKSCQIKTRTVPVQFGTDARGYTFAAGNFLSLATTPLEKCETGACGEALWYTPRAPTSLFTVAVDRSSRVVEPLLKLKWSDAGQRSVFIGKFGEQASSQNQFVTTADFCSPHGKLF